MGLLDKLRGELIDIIEWIDDSRHVLVWRFPRYRNQIKNGAKLIVRPGQVAVFVHQGKLADVFEPGTYELTTGNMPILSTLQGWAHGFDSPFKSEVYFVSTRQITDLKWGTPNPVMLRDADFGPVRLRAFGTYALRATEPRALLNELVGTDSQFEAEEISELLRSMINTAFAELVGSAKISVLDLAANYQKFSDELRQNIVARVDDEYGLDVPQLFIVNISLPEEVEIALDTRTKMGILGDMGRFQQYQMGIALTEAASNPHGGGATEGLGLGMGFAMAGQMMRGVGQASSPPPLQGAAPQWYVAENGQSMGPFHPTQLSEWAQGGRLRRDTHVWCAGMASWTAAGQIPQLAALFQPATPPPPPPASAS
ncbi:MAG: SPFH domain-containing protein [Planctomycetota bacterium]